MKNLIGFILLICPLFLNGQNATISYPSVDTSVLNDTKVYYFEKHKSVVFPKKYEPNFNRDYLQVRYTPDSLEILLVEKKLIEQYVEAFKRYLEAEWKEFEANKHHYDWNELVQNKNERETKLIAASEKTLKSIDKYDRQYLGLINSKGERIILIQLIKFKADPYELKETIENGWLTGFGDWFEENTSSFEYVIDRDKLYFFGWTER